MRKPIRPRLSCVASRCRMGRGNTGSAVCTRPLDHKPPQVPPLPPHELEALGVAGPSACGFCGQATVAAEITALCKRWSRCLQRANRTDECHSVLTSMYPPFVTASTAATTRGSALRMRGQLVVCSTNTAMLRPARFCWYFRFLSVVMKASNRACSAAAMSSPFFKPDQPRSYAVSTVWPTSAWRSGAGVPWSNRINTYTTSSALRAACSSTVRA